MISSAGTHLAIWIFRYFHFDFSIRNIAIFSNILAHCAYRNYLEDHVLASRVDTHKMRLECNPLNCISIVQILVVPGIKSSVRWHLYCITTWWIFFKHIHLVYCYVCTSIHIYFFYISILLQYIALDLMNVATYVLEVIS